LRFVVPAKAGTQRLCSRFAFGVSRQPTHVPVFFSRHPWRASHFLLLAQEKVTKEKGTPEGAVGRWPTARVRCGGSLTAHPCADSERARFLRAPLRAFSSAHSPRPRGPEDQERSEAERAPLCLLTSNPCDAAEGGRKGPKGTREGSRVFRCGPWMARQRNPAARSEPAAGGRVTRVPFLLVTSLWASKEK
jgi:hypothetical protein